MSTPGAVGGVQRQRGSRWLARTRVRCSRNMARCLRVRCNTSRSVERRARSRLDGESCGRSAPCCFRTWTARSGVRPGRSAFDVGSRAGSCRRCRGLLGDLGRSCAAVGRVLRRASTGLRHSARSSGQRVSTLGVESADGHTVRNDDQLCGSGTNTGRCAQSPRRGRGEWSQSDSDHRALSPRHRIRWITHGVLCGHGDQEVFARVRTASERVNPTAHASSRSRVDHIDSKVNVAWRLPTARDACAQLPARRACEPCAGP